MVRRASQNQHAPPPAASLGMARPPAIYVTAILTGLVLHFVWPIPFVPNWAIPFAGLIAAFAATLCLWGSRTFHPAGTPLPANHPTTPIGPQRELVRSA